MPKVKKKSEKKTIKTMDGVESTCIPSGKYIDIKSSTSDLASSEVKKEVQAKLDETSKEKRQNLIESIVAWARWAAKQNKNFTDLGDSTGCREILNDSFIIILQHVYKLICGVAIILLIFLMTFDFLKAVAARDQDGIQEAFKRSKNRVIAFVILFLLPVILDVIINVMNTNLHFNDNQIEVGNVSDCQVTK